jgi:hypothetical protein|tara:strand:- start:131 stop:703 length:573 start_codon:yes stop_codon:yes gene_type:complete
MFVLVENNSITKTVNTNKGITIGENQYPRAIFSLWSAAEREAIGIYDVVFDNTNFKDTQYYINTNPTLTFGGTTATSSYGNAVARELDDTTEVDDNGDTVSTQGLKSKKKIEIKSQSNNLLTSTDWHVIKATEVESYSVPAEQTTYRAAVRTASNDMEALIDACTSVDELAALYVYTNGSRPLGEFPEAV